MDLHGSQGKGAYEGNEEIRGEQEEEAVTAERSPKSGAKEARERIAAHGVNGLVWSGEGGEGGWQNG